MHDKNITIAGSGVLGSQIAFSNCIQRVQRVSL